ncbi:ABC transporter substrate-binding protein [Paenibacillus sp. YIM B09110]|uniref:ABC transporter substrate-binding protein n=1 Tax=Paenibacillus sp. YIM B09110 TaxID=3126102 RepID=UPI00301BD52E
MNRVGNCTLLLAAIIIVLSTCLSGCSSHNDSQQHNMNESAITDNNNEKEVKLVGYLIGEAPAGMPEVLKALNVKLKRDINATLELKYIGWSDLQSKYPLLLESGEQIDFIFASDWNFYVSEATRGAFLPLSMEMLNEYMPRHMDKLPPEAWNSTLVNGISYMIPTSSPDRKVNVALFRKDVMNRAGMDEISKFSEIEPYLAEIKRNYPEMIPLNLDSQFDLSTPYSYLLSEKIAWAGAPFDSGEPLAQGITSDIENPSGELWTMVEEPMLSVQKYAAGIMKSWYDKGYINRNPFANKERSKDTFCEGKAGVAFGNSNDMVSVFSLCAEKGIEVYPFPMLYPSGKSSNATWLNNGVALGVHSKHPERAMQALDLIMEEPAYVYLTYFGIEGINYVMTDDGKIGLPEGVTTETNTYPPDASGFWFVNKDLFKPMTTWSEPYIKLKEQIEHYLVPTTYMGFLFNSSNVKSEIAALKNVSTQYAQPIYFGAVDDMDAAFDTLTAKLKAAGIDRVKAEVEQQAALFMANKKR